MGLDVKPLQLAVSLLAVPSSLLFFYDAGKLGLQKGKRRSEYRIDFFPTKI